ncbi:MAG: ParB/RepB/Spo0J family partition protein [Clostridia bacterium]|nr:ParB/RepB/Spo0J family partition protein [Clostridia bacterium]
MKKKSTGLGLGLDAIFEDNDFSAEQPSGEETVHTLRISQIEPNRNQPRKVFDEEALQALAESIARHGLIQPLLVEPLKGDRYRIIAGERRWRACRIAGVEEVPVVIRTVTEQQNMEIALIENLQREDLNPIEEAKGYQSLTELYHMTQEQIAASVGKSRSAVANTMRLLALPEQIMDFVASGELSTGHAKALMALEEEDMLFYANKVISEGLTVRQTEALVKKALAPKKDKLSFDQEIVLALRAMEQQASESVGNKVSIHHSPKNKGKVEISYHSVEELEKIIDVLKGGVSHD